MNEDLPTVTLSEAKSIIKSLAHKQSVLLLSPPGVGKSESIMQAAADAGLECRSLLGTQIAPEDVSGIPRIVGERSVFCPPRVLLPEEPKPFCLFLDELPACTPEIQKSFYSLLLERRLGEHSLPKGTWVVAAGNRAEDRSLVRSISAALINRVIILHVRVDVKEWLTWGHSAGIRSEILSFITFNPDSLMRPIPRTPVPFSTPRAWVSLSRSLDLLEMEGAINLASIRAIAYGRVSPEDAAMFTVFFESNLGSLKKPITYLKGVEPLPENRTQRWFILHGIRQLFMTQWTFLKQNTSSNQICNFLQNVKREERAALLLELVEKWSKLGADKEICKTLEEITGITIEKKTENE